MSTHHHALHRAGPAWADAAGAQPLSSPSIWDNDNAAASSSPRAFVPPIIIPTLTPPSSIELSRSDVLYGSPPPSPLLPPASPALSAISNLTLNNSLNPKSSCGSLKPTSPTHPSTLLARRRGGVSLSPLLTPAVLPPAPSSARLSPLPSPSPVTKPPTSAGFSPPLSPHFTNPFDERSQRSRQVRTIMQGVRLAPAARTVDVNVVTAGPGRVRARSVGAEFGDARLLSPRTVASPMGSARRDSAGGGSGTGGALLTPPKSGGSNRRTTG